METSGFKEDSEEASGLSEELNDITDEPIGMGIWRSLCNSLTKSIDLTLIRRKRSQTNESSSLDPERNPSSQDMKGTTKGVLAKITQLYDQVSKKFYTPMEECAPCWTLIMAISGLVAITSIHSVVLCVLCTKLRTARKRFKETMEMESTKKETPGRGLKAAATRLGKARATHRKGSLSYKFVPTMET